MKIKFTRPAPAGPVQYDHPQVPSVGDFVHLPDPDGPFVVTRVRHFVSVMGVVDAEVHLRVAVRSD